jgi:hypothetical protein
MRELRSSIATPHDPPPATPKDPPPPPLPDKGGLPQKKWPGR